MTPMLAMTLSVRLMFFGGAIYVLSPTLAVVSALFTIGAYIGSGNPDVLTPVMMGCFVVSMIIGMVKKIGFANKVRI